MSTGVEYAYDWKWIGVSLTGLVQFQWLALFARALFFIGADVGVRFHLGRWFSLGVGGLLGVKVLDFEVPVGGFSVTPVMVHLGERGQHTLFAYVPVVFQRLGDSFSGVPVAPTLTVFPVLGYRYAFL